MSADFFRYVDSLKQGPREWIASDTYIVPLMDEGGNVRMWKAYDGVNPHYLHNRDDAVSTAPSRKGDVR